MPQSPETILTNLKKGEFATFYFLQGEENFYITQIADFIEKNAVPEAEKAFNLTLLYGAERTLAEIIGNAKRYPVMAQRQVVIVKEAQDIKDLSKEKGEELLIRYVSNPVPSTILVFCYRGKKLDKRKSLYKTIDKYAIVVDSEKMYDNQLPAWINNYIEMKGHSVDINAQHLLADSIGNDLERLSNEIDKMLINFKEPITITPGIVSKFVGISKEYNSFELQKAIGARNILKANRIINYFSENPRVNPVIPVIALIFSYFSKLMIIHKAGPIRDSELAAMVGVPPFFIKEYIQASKIYSLKKVIENIHYIRDADLMSKGIGISNISEGEILKELVYKIMHKSFL
jgi:DNA polymerase-3 subunit delta